MKHPSPSDFIINVEESHVSAIFKPSNSDYYFDRLADPEDIARFGPLIPECETRDYWRYRRLSIGRSRTDGTFVGCQGDHKTLTVRQMRRRSIQQ